MKKNIKVIILTLLIMALTSILGFAQEERGVENSKTKYSIEIDPATFVFNGYGFHLRIKPSNNKHLLFGVGAYSMDFPDLIVNLNSKNKNRNWKVRLNQGVGLFGEYHFEKVNNKWFLGVQIAIQEYKIENNNEAGSEKFKTFLGMSYAGYTFKPFKNNGFYIKPWAGIGYTSKISGKNILGNSKYDISPFLLFATIHFGFTF